MKDFPYNFPGGKAPRIRRNQFSATFVLRVRLPDHITKADMRDYIKGAIRTYKEKFAGDHPIKQLCDDDIKLFNGRTRTDSTVAFDKDPV